MAKTNVVRGEFSPVAGSAVRRMFDKDDNFIGTVTKCPEGYRIVRFPDRKTRVKATLAEAYRSIGRVN